MKLLPNISEATEAWAYLIKTLPFAFRGNQSLSSASELSEAWAYLIKRREALDYDIVEATVEWERLASEHEDFMKKYNEED